MWNLVLPILILYQHLLLTQSFKFTAVSPKTLRPFSTHQVVVSLVPHETVDTIQFLAILNSDSVKYESTPEEISTGVSAILKINVKELPDIVYNLTIIAKGTSGETYNETRQVYFDKRTATILIQTSKQIYNPKETIQFRVLVLDRFLKPFKDTKAVDIFVYDGRKNVVKSILSAKVNEYGLISDQVYIQPEPAMGTWRIEATYFDHTKEVREISVEHYELPKFEVFMKMTPKFITHNDSKVVVHVKADSFLGDPVKGKATVTLSYSYPRWSRSNDQKESVEKTFEINGMASETFNVAEELGVQETDVRDSIEFKFVAKVTGQLTGNVQYATKRIKMHRYPHKIEAVKQQLNFKPGFPLILTLKVSTQDDVPISDENPEALTIKHGFAYNAADGVIKSSIPKTGLVKLKFWTPSNVYMSILYIQVEYKGLTQRIFLPKRVESPTETYMTLELIEKKALVAPSNISVHVSSNREFQYVNYIVLTRGKVLSAGRFDFDKPDNNHTIPIYMGNKVTPKTTLIVYTIIPPFKEVVVDTFRMKFKVNKDRLNLKFSKTSVEPNENVEVAIKAPSNALVALRAIDQSVFIATEDQDIDNALLKKKMEEFERVGSSWGDHWYTSFEDAGLVLHTNCQPEERDIRGNPPVTLSAGPPGMSIMSSPSPNFDIGNQRVRKYFPQAWIWEEILSGPTGETKINKTVPDSMTSWILGGYSLDAENGLVVSKRSAKLKVTRPFFITFNCPPYVKIGEAVSIIILVRNNMKEDLPTKIVFYNEAGDFQFSEMDKKDSSTMEKQISAKSQEISTLIFIVTPQKIGELLIKVAATCPQAGDTVEKSLHVIPPGMKKVGKAERIIDLKESSSVHVNLTALIPIQRVPNADTVILKMKGNILGTALYDIHDLVRMPGGDGEKNLVALATNVILDSYMTTKKVHTSETLQKAKKFISQGMETQLSYRRPDGSFSKYGKSDRYGSTLGTALSLRVFEVVALTDYYNVDKSIVESAMEFLLQQQESEGFFTDKGSAFSLPVAGSAREIAITAYVLLAFAEIKSLPVDKYAEAINKAQKALIEAGKKSSSAYIINLIAYYLHHIDHREKDTFYEKSQELIRKRNEYEGYMEFWSDNETYIRREGDGMDQFRTTDVEITSYGLRIYLFRDEIEDSFPVLTYILHERNVNEMFMTPMGALASLAAVAKYDLSTWGSHVDLDILATWTTGQQQIKVTTENALIVQQFTLDSCSRTVALVGNGTGTALAQLQWTYHTEDPMKDGVTQTETAFGLTVDVSI